MRKADRLFQIVNLIRVHQPITAQALADRLEVSVRSIYRYIDDISLSGIPVYGEPGVGYAMHRHFELPPLSLSADELAALTLSVNMLSRAAGHELGQAARSLLAKIEAVAPEPVTPDAQAAIRSMAEPLSNAQRRHWDLLRCAIGKRQVIHMTYRSLSEQATTREVLPLGLFYWGGKWTTGAWCLLRQAYRDFRVDLIESAHAVTHAPCVPAAIQLDAYMQHRADNWPAAEHH